MQAFQHVGYKNSFQISQHDLQGEREREPKLTRGSTPVCRFFPGKAPSNFTVVYSAAGGRDINVGYGREDKNLKRRQGTWMRKSGKSFEVKGKGTMRVMLKDSSSRAGIN